MSKKIQKDAWRLDNEHMLILAAVASAKKVTLQQLNDAGLEANQTHIDNLISLELVKMEKDVCRTTETGRSLLWHQKWAYSGYPIFAHTRVVSWALYLNEVFGEIQTFRLEMDLGMNEDDLEPHLTKMAKHNMIVRDGEKAILLDKSKWKMDY